MTRVRQRLFFFAVAPPRVALFFGAAFFFAAPFAPLPFFFAFLAVFRAFAFPPVSGGAFAFASGDGCFG